MVEDCLIAIRAISGSNPSYHVQWLLDSFFKFMFQTVSLKQLVVSKIFYTYISCLSLMVWLTRENGLDKRMRDTFE